MASARLKDKDKGFKAFVQRLKDTDDTRAVIGVYGGKAREKHELKGNKGVPLRMSELATIHEFGARKANIPQRSFLRGTMDKFSRKYDRDLRVGVKDIVRGKKPRAVMFQLGEKVRGDIIDRIDQSDFAPNKPAVKRRKGGAGTKPLVDLGHLRASIRSKVSSKSKVTK